MAGPNSDADGDGGCIFRRRFISQLLATEVVNILKILDGMHRGYMISLILSPYLNPKIEVREERGVRPSEEYLWIPPLFSILALPFFGTLFIDRFGRRLSLVVAYLFSLFSWIFMLTTTDTFHLYLAMGLAGIARGGANMAIPIFVTEICNPRIRGRLLTVSTLNENVGLMVGFFVAYFTARLVTVGALVMLSLIFLGFLFSLHESPIYYFKRGNFVAGEISLKYYWNVKNYSSLRDSDDYVDYLDNIRRKWETAQYQYNIAGTSKSFRSVKCSTRNLVLSVVMGSFPAFTGGYFFMYYLGNLKFREHTFRGDFMTTIIAILIMAVSGAKCSALLVDRIGRVSTLTISGCGSIAALFLSYSLDYVSFTFSMFEVDWILISSLALLSFFANIGFTTTWTSTALELLNDEQRLKGFGLSNALAFFLEILMTASFSHLFQSLHFHGFILIHLLGTVLNLIIVKNCIPETQGKWLIN